jgi:hypothetical protein
LGIALLLLFEDLVFKDLALEALGATTLAAVLAGRVTLTETPARPLVALRLAAGAFFEAFEEAFTVLETLFLRVFCDTACARELPRPCLMITGNPTGPIERHHRVQLLECAYNSTFPAKINDLCPAQALLG